LNPLAGCGFSPSKIKGIDSGFEISSEPSQEILVSYPHLIQKIGARDWCITFRWGGDVHEAACVLAASAGLLKTSDALAFYPDDDLIYDLDQLLQEAHSAID
jgi:hypothetical protein